MIRLSEIRAYKVLHYLKIDVTNMKEATYNMSCYASQYLKEMRVYAVSGTGSRVIIVGPSNGPNLILIKGLWPLLLKLKYHFQ